ncbi:MAG: (2Fe-2S)-binding protein, partial [Acidobacteriaceae bacterium]
MNRVLLNVNGVDRSLVVDPQKSLADVLREQLLLTGCKICCDEGHCGTCSVIIDGKSKRACLIPMAKVEEGAKITTIEGIGTPGDLHPVQVAWMAHGGAQCGVCTPGFIVSAKVLLDKNASPTREEVRKWFDTNRNACRCTGYKQLVDAVMDAAAVVRGEKKKEDLLFQPGENGSILGSKYHRPSAMAKVTGTWDFGADVALH